MTLIIKNLVITSEVYHDKTGQEPIDVVQFKRELLKSCERMIEKKLRRG